MGWQSARLAAVGWLYVIKAANLRNTRGLFMLCHLILWRPLSAKYIGAAWRTWRKKAKHQAAIFCRIFNHSAKVKLTTQKYSNAARENLKAWKKKLWLSIPISHHLMTLYGEGDISTWKNGGPLFLHSRILL